jgi:hypothetical protein
MAELKAVDSVRVAEEERRGEQLLRAADAEQVGFSRVVALCCLCF